MKNKIFSGIMPAMITPINSDGTFRRDAAEQVIRMEMRHPIDGFYINGATGEGPILPEKTRMEMAELSVELVRGKGVIINHIGAPDVQSAVRLAKHAAKIGCDAISSVMPNFFFKFNMEQIIDYYKRIGEAAGIPIIAYVNGLANQDPIEFMSKAMEIPEVVGLKYTNYDYYSMHRICELNGGDITVFNGPDELLLCGLIMGADGGIGSTYNVMPGWFCDLYRAYKDGRIEEAKEIQFKINKVIPILIKYSLVPAIKEYFKYFDIDTGYAAYPGKRLTDDELKAMRIELREAGLENL